MRRNERDRSDMKWDVMDILNMTYKDNSFDLIVDKSMIDTILCTKTPYINMAIMLSEC